MAISTGLRKYLKINDKFHFSAMAKGRITQVSKAPFFNQRAIGYGQDYIRGYDYYVLNGQNYLLMKSQLKYTLMKRRIYRTSFVRSEKFNQIPVAMYLNFLLMEVMYKINSTTDIIIYQTNFSIHTA